MLILFSVRYTSSNIHKVKNISFIVSLMQQWWDVLCSKCPAKCLNTNTVHGTSLSTLKLILIQTCENGTAILEFQWMQSNVLFFLGRVVLCGDEEVIRTRILHSSCSMRHKKIFHDRKRNNPFLQFFLAATIIISMAVLTGILSMNCQPLYSAQFYSYHLILI